MSEAPAIVILAAGHGTRMYSHKPKVLHRLMGRPLIDHVLNAARYLNPARLVVVTGFGAGAVEAEAKAFTAALPGGPAPIFARQAEQLGTGHAVLQAKEALAGFGGTVVIMYGDMPLISPGTLDGFLKAHQALQAHLSVLTVTLDDPGAYGRVIRDSGRWLERIVEARDATDEERQVREINSGLYAVDGRHLFGALEGLKTDNDQKEYYLPDIVTAFRAQGLTAAAVEIPPSLAYEVEGANNRYELARLEAILKDRINESWMRAGVTMMGPLSTFIECTVKLARDVTLWPSVILTGRTTVGEGAEIGPFCHLNDCAIAPGARVPGHQCLTGVEIKP